MVYTTKADCATPRQFSCLCSSGGENEKCEEKNGEAQNEGEKCEEVGKGGRSARRFEWFEARAGGSSGARRFDHNRRCSCRTTTVLLSL